MADGDAEIIRLDIVGICINIMWYGACNEAGTRGWGGTAGTDGRETKFMQRRVPVGSERQGG